MKKIGTSIAGAAGSMVVLTLLSRLVGFVRTRAQSGALGDTASGGAYSAANTVPDVLFETTAGGAFAGAIIPLVSDFLAKGIKGELECIASALVMWILAVGLSIAGTVILAAKPITRALLGAHRSPKELAPAATLLQAFALQVPLYGLSVMPTDIFQAHKRFLLPAFTPMLSSVAVIAVFTVFAQAAGGKRDSPGTLTEVAMVWLGWEIAVSVMAFTLPQIVPVAKIVRLGSTLRFPDGVARRAQGLIGVGLSELLARQVQTVTIMVVANSFGDTGAYSAYTFVNAICMVPYAVLAVLVATTIFPRLLEAAALPGRPGLTSLTARSTRLVLDVGTVTVVLLAILTSPAGLVFEIPHPARGMDVVMLIIILGLAGCALIYHGSHVLYAVEAPRAIVLVDFLAWLSVCVALGTSVAIGIDGRRQTLIAVGASVPVGMMIGAISQITAIRRAVRKRATIDMTRSTLIMGAASAIGAALGYMAIRLVLGVLGAGDVGAFTSAAVDGVVVLSAGGGAVLLFDRDTLRLTGSAKEPGVEGSGAKGPGIERPTPDGADTQ